MTQNVSDTLNLAADLIEERGWTTGSGWLFADTPEGAPLCLEGGIMAALGMRFPMKFDESAPEELWGPLWSCPAYVAVCTHLDREVPTVGERAGYPLYDWNDCRDRTAAEVVEVLRATAVIESARERTAAEATA